MNILIKKMDNLGLLKLELISGIVLMAAAVIFPPIGILLTDPSLMKNPYLIGVLLVTMLIFALLGYCLFVRPFLLYRKLPEVQAEADSEFLYIHTKKEDKIPLSALAYAEVRAELPFLLQKDFLREIIINIFSHHYGTLVLEVPDYGTYKMRFVANVSDAADDFVRFIYTIVV